MSHRYELTFYSYVLCHISVIKVSFLCAISRRYELTFHSYVLYHIGVIKVSFQVLRHIGMN